MQSFSFCVSAHEVYFCDIGFPRNLLCHKRSGRTTYRRPPYKRFYFLRAIIRYITITSTITATIWINHPHWNRILNTTENGINRSSIDTIKYNIQSQIENMRRLIALPYRIIFFSSFVIIPISHCCSILLISSKLSTFFLATLILKLYSSWVTHWIYSTRTRRIAKSPFPILSM